MVQAASAAVSRHVRRLFSPAGYSYFISSLDFVTWVYLLLTLPLYLVRLVSPLWFAVHLLLIVAIPSIRHLLFRPNIRQLHYSLDWLLELYPTFFHFFLYSEISVLNQTVHNGVLFDDAVVQWEDAIFRSSPAQDLHKWLPNRVLGEYLHFCYFSLYIIIPSLPLVLFFTRDRVTFYKGAGTLLFTFYFGFLCYILFPVEGPYWRYVPPNPDDVGYLFSHLVHSIVSGGSAGGTAFPSSHCGIAVAAWLLAMRHHRPLALAYFFCVPGLVVSTVYGGFHYATDAVAGMCMAVFCVTFGHSLITSALVRILEHRPHDGPFDGLPVLLPLHHRKHELSKS
eukprot:TRINITY_DN2148_c0_g1_i1.p1 TRINITY_DN2148_c0_g1~~TRINITY_DN2148_c0_g1_i1.p1  ORF type:complete len:338 (-),score=59.43 TRINITY_DN2148_c0_g1_i1:63-1076(-)